MNSLKQDLELLVREAHSRSGIPGLAVSLSVGDERISATAGNAGNGNPMSANSRFQIGCITKMLTSLVALDLTYAGKLGLDAPIREYLPELHTPSGGSGITVGHLASHTSGYRGLNPGLPQFGYFYTWPKFVDFFGSTEQVFAPGTTFNYEHTESVILGEIVRRVTGVPVERIIQEKIVRPLGLRLGNVVAAGEQTPVIDYSRDAASGEYRPMRAVPFCDFWMASLSNWTAGVGDLGILAESMFTPGASWEVDGRAVRHASRALIELPAVITGRHSEHVPASFGMGCAEYAGHLLGHNGSGRGQTCGLRFNPERRMAIVVALNAWQPYLRDYLLNAVSRLVGPVSPAPVRVPAVAKFESADIEGIYAGCVGGSELRVSRRGAELSCDLADATGAVKAGMILTLGVDGPKLKSDMPHLSIGPFRVGPQSEPCMMLGLNAFKKDATRERTN